MIEQKLKSEPSHESLQNSNVWRFIMIIVKSKKLILLVSLFVFVFVVGSINSARAARVQSLTITTGGVGGGWYPIGGGIANIINPKIKQYGFRAGAVPGGGVLNPARVGMDEADMGLTQSSFLILAQKGEKPYDTKYPKLRAICKIFDQALHYAVAEDSGVESIRQIVNDKMKLRFGPNKVGTSSEFIFNKLMAAYGAPVDTLKDWGWKLDYGGQGHQLSQYRDKHIDGFIMHTQVPNSATMEACLARKTRFLNVDDEAAAIMKKEWGTKRTVIPAKTYEGQTEDVNTITMPNVLFTTTDLPDDVVYEIVKIMFEKKEYLTKVHVLFGDFTHQTAIEGLGIQLHPGAERYFKEVGAIK